MAIFVDNAETIARNAMRAVRPDLADQYSTLIRFLTAHVSYASEMRGGRSPSIGTRDYIVRQATAFAAGREPRAPQPPTTVPDEMVSVILSEYFEIPASELEKAKRTHLLSMGAENLVGDLLERYIASELEPRGWVWCSGSVVRAVDFIRPPSRADGDWALLQVKNRDNSENSSSSAIRDGTSIEKWHRTFSRRSGSNWGEFPDIKARTCLSEEGFKKFVRKYLRELRSL